MATIEERAGSWRVNYRLADRSGRLVRDESGKTPRVSTTWPTEKLAKQAKDVAEAHRHTMTAAQLYEAILGPSGEQASTAPTLAEWFAEFLPSKTRLSLGTRAQYEQQFRQHIAPTFGNTPLDRIAPPDIGRWINKRREKVKNSTVTREFTLLSMTLKAAVARGHIDRNPCSDTDFERDRKDDDDVGEEKAEKVLTHDEYETLWAAFPERWRLLLDTLAGTGARWSEATALTVAHIVHPTEKDPEPSIRLWQAWKRTGKGDGRYIGQTKGRTKRTVPIDKDLYERLVEAVKGKKKDDLIFAGPNGDRLHYSNFWNKVWVPILIELQRCPVHPPTRREQPRTGPSVRCGDSGARSSNGKPCGRWAVKGTDRCKGHSGPEPGAVSTCDCPGLLRLGGEVYGPHLLRHTYASWLFDDGVPQLLISRLMGHSSTRVTDEIYGHRLKTSDQAARESLLRSRKLRRGEKGDVSSS